VPVELILHNAKIATNAVPSLVEAIAVSDGKITAVGNDDDILRLRGPHTQVIDGRRRTIIPGLNDSHMHPIRGGLNYNMELRWDGVPSLADALRMLKEQAARTPAPQWVRVVGGWTEFQFAERRMPTLDEINAVAPDTPVFVMHLYDRAFLNAAALRAVGYDKNAPNFPAGEKNTAATRMPQQERWERHIPELSLRFVLAPRIITFQCWVILGSGIWDAIVSPFEKWQPNS
jgi:predicted amidohydrolase YtcJ